MPKAVSVTEEIMDEHTQDISDLTLIPSKGGVFEVIVGDSLIFSKKDLGRFPEPGEITKLFGKTVK